VVEEEIYFRIWKTPYYTQGGIIGEKPCYNAPAFKSKLDAPLIASLEDEMNKLIIVSVIATVIAANFVGRKLRGAASH
jgi:hypothetical protein